MDRKTLQALQHACHIELTESETELFLTELQEIEDSFPDLGRDVPIYGAAERPLSQFRADVPSLTGSKDPEMHRDAEGYYRVQGDGHE